MSDSEELTPGQQIKAELDVFEVLKLLWTHYGFNANTVVELDAYDDRNYRVLLRKDDKPPADNPHVTSLSKNGYIFKVINVLDSRNAGFFQAQSELLVFLNKRAIACPEPVKTKDGSYFATVTLNSGARHIVRLLVYQMGETLGKVSVSAGLLEKLGAYAGSLNVTLEEFSHPGYENRSSSWVLEKVPKLRKFLRYLKTDKEKKLVEDVIEEFESKVLPVCGSLARGIIHGDLNESNVLVSEDGASVAAIIDFGDSHKSCYLFELAICLCYMITKTRHIEMAKHVIKGYQSTKPLTAREHELLKLCVCARYAQSLTLGAYSSSREPANKYLTRDENLRWSLLDELWKIKNSEVMKLWGVE